MKINEQYHNLNLLENVTYEFWVVTEKLMKKQNQPCGTHDGCICK